jgi:hypothetical protein
LDSPYMIDSSKGRIQEKSSKVSTSHNNLWLILALSIHVKSRLSKILDFLRANEGLKNPKEK